MMMVPRSFVQNPLAQRQQQADFDEKEKDKFSKRKGRGSSSQSPPTRSELSQRLSEERAAAVDNPTSDPVRMPPRPHPRIQLNPRRPGPSSLQPPTLSPISPSQNVQNIPRRT